MPDSRSDDCAGVDRRPCPSYQTLPERRPLIAVPARFSASASALRYRAEVVPAALMECVYEAGGEPLAVHPGPEHDSDEVIAARLCWADGVLLPGGGDLAPRWSGQAAHPSLYDVDVRQDAFDLGVARVVLACDLPLLAICRGLHVVNVVLGGDLVQDMAETHHRHRRHEVAVLHGSGMSAIVAGRLGSRVTGPLLGQTSSRWADSLARHSASFMPMAGGPRLVVSCYHHQCLGRLGEGLRVVGRAEDGVVEAVELPGRAGWFVGTQWHPEDTALTDPAQLRLFEALVDAARRRAWHVV